MYWIVPSGSATMTISSPCSMAAISPEGSAGEALPVLEPQGDQYCRAGGIGDDMAEHHRPNVQEDHAAPPVSAAREGFYASTGEQSGVYWRPSVAAIEMPRSCVVRGHWTVV